MMIFFFCIVFLNYYEFLKPCFTCFTRPKNAIEVFECDNDARANRWFVQMVGEDKIKHRIIDPP